MKVAFYLFLISIPFFYFSCKSLNKTTETPISNVATDTFAKNSEEFIKVGNENCYYKIIEGKGTITYLNTSNPDHVVIKFRFEAAKKYISDYPDISDDERLFNVEGVGKYPPLAWCEAQGLEQGASFKCRKMELNTSDNPYLCEKVKFSFYEFEKNKW